MKLELRNVKVIKELSEETTCFHAILYVDGKKAAECSNRGTGGMTDVYFENQEIKEKVVNFCKKNPVVNYFGDKKIEYEGVDIRVDELLVEYQMKKDLKNKQKHSLVLRKEKFKDAPYIIHAYAKQLFPIEKMMQDETKRDSLRRQIIDLRKQGYTIMNTNIDYKSLGL